METVNTLTSQNVRQRRNTVVLFMSSFSHRSNADGIRILPGRTARRQKAPNSKLQAPKKHQVPNTKHQAPNSREAPSSELEARAAVWSLEPGISLVFGAWFLVFRFRNFSGAWSWRQMRTAPDANHAKQFFTVTHP